MVFIVKNATNYKVIKPNDRDKIVTTHLYLAIIVINTDPITNVYEKVYNTVIIHHHTYVDLINVVINKNKDLVKPK